MSKYLVTFDQYDVFCEATGGQKVLRGGGFWVSAKECRSASRVGVPAVNRGAGISFRIVKDK
jgi:formylglycine-generating enzyme required for sulfatase activity